MVSTKQLSKEIQAGKAAALEMSAYQIAHQLYGDEAFANLATNETSRAGWKFAGYDDNGNEVYTR